MYSFEKLAKKNRVHASTVTKARAKSINHFFIPGSYKGGEWKEEG